MINIRTIRKTYEKINSYFSWVNIGALRQASLFEKIKLTIIYFFPKIVSSKNKLILFIFKNKFYGFVNFSEFYTLINGLFTTQHLEEIACNVRINKKKSHSESIISKNLYLNGFYKLPDMYNFSENICKEFVKKSLENKCYNSHIPLQANLLSIPNSNYLYWSMRYEVWQEKYIKNLLNSPNLKNILLDYFGSSDFKIYSINTLISIPSSNCNTSVTKFHRDHDDIEFLTIFIYWTSTTKDDGSIRYVPESHLDLDCDCSSELNFINLEAKEGSVFLIDTFGLHAGNSNLLKPRVVTWVRLSKNSITHTSFYDGDVYNQILYKKLLV
jgi:hypothetical protein